MIPYNDFADVYDELNTDCDYQKWSQYLISIIKSYGIEKGTGIDYACGSGKLTYKFCDCGYNMIGVDRSQKMLAKALQNKKNFKQNVVFAQGDMQSFCYPKKVDFAICTCDGVNYLERDTEFKNFVNTVFSNLKQNGVFAFDVSSHHKLKNVLSNNLFSDETENVTYIWQNEFNDNNKTLFFNLSFFIKEKGNKDLYRRFDEEHFMYVYEVDFVKNVLKQAGFGKVYVYDCFSLNQVDNNNKSERIQFVAIKE